MIEKDREEALLKFDRFFLNQAMSEAKKSPDPSTKVGCVIVNHATASVLSRGFNSVPDRVSLFDRLEKRPDKYYWVLHGEARAIANAARDGNQLYKSWAYINWRTDGICPTCAGLLVQAGIVRIVGNGAEFPGMKKAADYDLFHIGKDKLLEAGVELVDIEYE